MNILFGDKGLGKTNILKSVRKKAEAGGKIVSTYIASEKDDYFKELLDVSDMDRSRETDSSYVSMLFLAKISLSSPQKNFCKLLLPP